DRRAERPASHLEHFRGVLQVDCYAGFERLTASGAVVLAACWAYVRRKFYECHGATGSPIAAEALRRIAELYAIEEGIRGQPAPASQAGKVARGASARHVAEDLARAGARSHSTGRYARRGNPLRARALVCSLLGSAKLNDIEPYAYLKDVLERVAAGHPANRLDELLPWNWRLEAALWPEGNSCASVAPQAAEIRRVEAARARLGSWRSSEDIDALVIRDFAARLARRSRTWRIPAYGAAHPGG